MFDSIKLEKNVYVCIKLLSRIFHCIVSITFEHRPPPTLENNKAVVYFRNTGMDTLETHKATQPASQWWPALFTGYMFFLNTGPGQPLTKLY